MTEFAARVQAMALCAVLRQAAVDMGNWPEGHRVAAWAETDGTYVVTVQWDGAVVWHQGYDARGRRV